MIASQRDKEPKVLAKSPNESREYRTWIGQIMVGIVASIGAAVGFTFLTVLLTGFTSNLQSAMAIAFVIVGILLAVVMAVVYRRLFLGDHWNGLRILRETGSSLAQSRSRTRKFVRLSILFNGVGLIAASAAYLGINLVSGTPHIEVTLLAFTMVVTAYLTTIAFVMVSPSASTSKEGLERRALLQRRTTLRHDLVTTDTLIAKSLSFAGRVQLNRRRDRIVQELAVINYRLGGDFQDMDNRSGKQVDHA